MPSIFVSVETISVYYGFDDELTYRREVCNVSKLQAKEAAVVNPFLQVKSMRNCL